MTSTMAEDPRLIAEREGFGGLIAMYRTRLAQGELGQVPVVVGLIVIWGIFWWASHGAFFNPLNLVNLALQMAAVGTIAVGVVFVLLLGEIDLTVGIVSGLCAAIMAVLNVKMGLPLEIAVILTLTIGTLFGLVAGFIRVPNVGFHLAALRASAR